MTEFLATNWLWIVFLAMMLAMHRHGGCGMHSHHQHHQTERDIEPVDIEPVDQVANGKRTS